MKTKTTTVTPSTSEERKQEILALDDETLVRNYQPLVKSVIGKYFFSGGADASFDKDDLLQVGLLALLKAQKKYDGTTAFSTYASAAVRNALLSEIRKHKPNMDFSNRVLMNMECLEENEEFSNFADKYPDLVDFSFGENLLFSSEFSSALNRTYASAKPANRRNIDFFLAHIDGESIESIAFRSGLASARVRTFINRGKAYLADQSVLRKIAFGA